MDMWCHNRNAGCNNIMKKVGLWKTLDGGRYKLGTRYHNRPARWYKVVKNLLLSYFGRVA